MGLSDRVVRPFGGIQGRVRLVEGGLAKERLHREMWERRTDFLMEYNLCMDCLEMRRDACHSGDCNHKVGWVPWGCVACQCLEPFIDTQRSERGRGRKRRRTL